MERIDERMKLTTQLAAQICTFLAIAYLVEPFMSLFSGNGYWFALNLPLGIVTAVPILLCGIGLRRSIVPAWWAMVLISAGGAILGLAYAIGGSSSMIGLSTLVIEPFYGLRTALLTFFPVPDVLVGLGAFLAYGSVLVMLLLDLPTSRQPEATEPTVTESADMGTETADTTPTPPSAWALAVRVVLVAIATIVIIFGVLIAYIGSFSPIKLSGDLPEGVFRCIAIACVLTVALIVRIDRRHRQRV